ncbi:hypothetical protein EZS27_004595 [termite gut metagenome]|uniref:Antitoxin n=1 Tax=termite gut metagenome TaxID=433724 RepID=A0A5J4SRN3_9ZZZZ
MVIISTQEFRDNQKKFFDLAEKERVIIKRKSKLVELVVTDKLSENPSPSGDPWFDNPENVREVERRCADIDSGKAKLIQIDVDNPWESILS